MITLNKKERLFIGLYFLFQQLFLVPILLLLPLPLNAAQLEFVYFVTNFVMTLLICHKYLWRNLKTINWDIIPVVFSGVVLYFIASSMVGILIQGIMPEFYNVNDSTIAYLMDSDFGLIIAGVVFFVPIAEEVMYRGLAFGSLYKRSKFLAYLVSTLVFSAIHVVGYIGMYEPMHLLLCLLQYVPASLCLCWAYAHSGNLFAPIFMHMIINAIGTFAMR